MKKNNAKAALVLPDSDLLHDAIADGDVDGLVALLACNHDPNAPITGNMRPLHTVCLKGRGAPDSVVHMANLLVLRGADINAVEDQAGLTPLMIAIERERHHLVEWLVAKGADCFVTSLDGKTALDILNGKIAEADVEKPEHARMAKALSPVFARRRIEEVSKSKPVAGKTVVGLPQIYAPKLRGLS